LFHKLALTTSVHFSDTHNSIRIDGFIAPLVLNIDTTTVGGDLYEPDALFSGKWSPPSPVETTGCVGSKWVRSGCCAEQKNLLVIPGIEPRFLPGHRAIYPFALLRTDYIEERKFVL
jgi:hypothetical protein